MEISEFPFTRRTSGPEETLSLAASFSRNLAPSDVVLLQGGLGAGKTHFVRGLCSGLGMDSPWEVDSPTYTIVNHYEVGPGLDHIDLYRLQDPHELESINLDELLESNSLKAIEWPERLIGYDFRGKGYLVNFVHEEGDARLIRITRIEGGVGDAL